MGMIILAITATRRRPARKKARPVQAYKREHKKIVASIFFLVINIRMWGSAPHSFC